MRLPIALLVTMLTAAIVRVASVWSRLPPVMASHFDGQGRPNGFMSRGAFFGFLALVEIGVPLLLVVTPVLVRRLPPELVNLPNREHWLAPERREEAFARLGGWARWFAVLTAAFMWLVLELTVRANLARASLENGPFIAGLVAYLVCTVAAIVALHRAFRLPRG